MAGKTSRKYEWFMKKEEILKGIDSTFLAVLKYCKNFLDFSEHDKQEKNKQQ